jgi:DNA primase
MFPIRNSQGKIIGFSGRMLKKEEGEAKYVNSPETPLFRKSQVLYGLYEARKEIVDKREAIICEGQIDVIRCHLAGFRNAVAAQGTAFTEDHARVIKRSADSTVIVFDSDTAGQTAAIRTGGIFLQAGLAVRAAQLPEGADPDSFIRDQGAPAFQVLLDKAVTIVEFLVSVWSKRENIRAEAGLVRVSKAVLQTVSQTSNAVLRARMIEEAAGLLSIPPQALEDDLRYMMRRSERMAANRAAAAQEEADSPERAAGEGKAARGADAGGRKTGSGDNVKHPREELELAEHIVANPKLGELVEKYMKLDMFEDGQCGAIIYAAIEADREQHDLMSVLVGKDDAEGSLARLAAKVQMAPEKTLGSESSREIAVKDLILYIWRRRLQKERGDLEQRVKAGPDKEAEDRLRQIPYDLKALRQWDSGSAIIEIELA